MLVVYCHFHWNAPCAFWTTERRDDKSRCDHMNIRFKLHLNILLIQIHWTFKMQCIRRSPSCFSNFSKTNGFNNLFLWKLLKFSSTNWKIINCIFELNIKVWCHYIKIEQMCNHSKSSARWRSLDRLTVNFCDWVSHSMNVPTWRKKTDDYSIRKMCRNSDALEFTLGFF